jgi:hypothetical protein
MTVEHALGVLSQAANQQIDWAIGDLLRERTKRDDWRDCTILRQLENSAPGLALWNDLIRRAREALSEEAQLPAKA